MIFGKRHPPVGSRPGTLAIGDDAAPTTVSVYRYTAAEWEVERLDDLDRLPAVLERGA